MAHLGRTTAMVLAASSLLLGGCGADEPSGAESTAASDTRQVEVVNISFSPQTLEIKSGTTVEWTNEDEGVDHTATSGLPGDNGVPGVSRAKPPKHDGVFDGDLADGSAPFSFTFSDPGTYAYFCRVHPSMIGEVIVN